LRKGDRQRALGGARGASGRRRRRRRRRSGRRAGLFVGRWERGEEYGD